MILPQSCTHKNISTKKLLFRSERNMAQTQIKTKYKIKFNWRLLIALHIMNIAITFAFGINLPDMITFTYLVISTIAIFIACYEKIEKYKEIPTENT
jgi:hypothetical protein